MKACSPLIRGIPMLAVFMVLASCSNLPKLDESSPQLHRDAHDALANLYEQNAGAKAMGQRARAIMVFPAIVKGGFIVGGQFGRGVLFENGRVVANYETAAASYGFQAGLQKYGYALFFMHQDGLDYLRRTGGWEIGAGPSIVVVDEGLARSLSTTTVRKGIYAFFFDQRGLMGGLGLQGAKIWRVD